MCDEFSCIFVYDGRVLWNLEHSHSAIAKAANLSDRVTGTRRKYLKVECTDLTMNSFRIEDDDALPGWYNDHQDEFKAKLNGILEKYADYAAKRDTLYADFEAKRAPLDADYAAKRNTLYAETMQILGYIE